MNEEERKNIGKLLDEVGRKVSELQYDATFSFPNIFIMEDIVRDETKMCKFLSRLLNAEYNPKYGAQMIVSFLTDVMHFDKETIGDKKGWTSLREYMIPNGKRIDIVLVNWDRRLFIPIEAKIDAKDRENQCKDYLEYAKTKYYFDGLKLGYLTIWGDTPSDKSYSRQDDRDIESITWAGIGEWLNNFADGSDDYNFKFCVSQFCNAIKMFTVHEKEVAAMKKIIHDKKDYEAAVFISDNLDKVKAYKIRELFEDVEKLINNKLINNKLLNQNDGFLQKIVLWGGYEEAVKNYYKKNKKTFPAITYLVEKAKLKKEYQEALGNFDLAIRIEIEDKLYIGLCVPYLGDENESSTINIGPQKKEQIQNLSKFISTYDGKDGWWLCWKYVEIDNGQLNFKDNGYDSVIAKLFDENERKKIINKIVDEVFFECFYNKVRDEFVE